MEPAVVQLPPQYIVFDLSGAGLRCFGPPPASAEQIGVSFDADAQAMGSPALHRARLSRADDLATNRQIQAELGVMAWSVSAETSDPDTVSDAGTPGVRLRQVGEESEDEVDSFDAFFCQEAIARKIDALAELVGVKGDYEPVSVLGEVVRVLQSIDTIEEGPMSD